MMLKGKCLEVFLDFIEYKYVGNYTVEYPMIGDLEGTCYNVLTEEYFHQLPFSAKYGVIVDFFDQCEVEGVNDTVQLEMGYIAGGHTRQEARGFAVEKNCKRYNQNFE